MAEAPEAQVLAFFVAHLRAGKMKPLRLEHVVTGGLPAEADDVPAVTVGGDGRARLVSGREQSGITLDEAEVRELFDLAADGAEAMMPRSRAAFPPDTRVGLFTLVIEAERAEFFHPDDPVQAGDGALAAATSRVLERLADLRTRLLRAAD